MFCLHKNENVSFSLYKNITKLLRVLKNNEKNSQRIFDSKKNITTEHKGQCCNGKIKKFIEKKKFIWPNKHMIVQFRVILMKTKYLIFALRVDKKINENTPVLIGLL